MIETLKNTFRGSMAAAGLTAMSVLSPTAVFAEEAPQATNISNPVRAIDRVNLRVKDVRDESPDFAEALAIAGSSQVVIVKIHPENDDTIEDVTTYLKRMKMAGYDRVGLLIANGRNGADDTAEFYMGGLEKPWNVIDDISGIGAGAKIVKALQASTPKEWAPEKPDVTASLEL